MIGCCTIVAANGKFVAISATVVYKACARGSCVEWGSYEKTAVGWIQGVAQDEGQAVAERAQPAVGVTLPKLTPLTCFRYSKSPANLSEPKRKYSYFYFLFEALPYVAFMFLVCNSDAPLPLS